MDEGNDSEGEVTTQESRAVGPHTTHLSLESFSLPSVWSPACSPDLRSEWRNRNHTVNILKAARADNHRAQGGGFGLIVEVVAQKGGLDGPHSGRTGPANLLVPASVHVQIIAHLLLTKPPGCCGRLWPGQRWTATPPRSNLLFLRGLRGRRGNVYSK